MFVSVGGWWFYLHNIGCDEYGLLQHGISSTDDGTRTPFSVCELIGVTFVWLSCHTADGVDVLGAYGQYP